MLIHHMTSSLTGVEDGSVWKEVEREREKVSTEKHKPPRGPSLHEYSIKY